MATSSLSTDGESDTVKSTDKERVNERGHWMDRVNDRFRDRRIHTDPKPNSWMIVAAGSIAPLGLAGAALAATYLTKYEKVAIAAWVAVAVVGTASVISAAAVSHKRTVEVEHSDQGTKSKHREHEASRGSD